MHTVNKAWATGLEHLSVAMVTFFREDGKDDKAGVSDHSGFPDVRASVTPRFSRDAGWKLPH